MSSETLSSHVSWDSSLYPPPQVHFGLLRVVSPDAYSPSSGVSAPGARALDSPFPRIVPTLRLLEDSAIFFNRPFPTEYLVLVKASFRKRGCAIAVPQSVCGFPFFPPDTVPVAVLASFPHEPNGVRRVVTRGRFEVQILSSRCVRMRPGVYFDSFPLGGCS